NSQAGSIKVLLAGTVGTSMTFSQVPMAVMQTGQARF
ncbi:hypothetical protein PSYAR_11724, partial [Pseudomonas syringae pv. aceris str. M302273]